MAKIYYRRIIAGDISIKDVPEKWRNDVILLLEEDGYDIYQ